MADKPIQMPDIYVGARQLTNPDNRKVSSDTDTPPDSTRMSGGAKMRDGGGPAKMDISNPPRAELLPKEHPLEEHFKKSGPRHQLGSKMPVMSDN